MHREVKMRFDQEGISIPFPQRDVHHYYPETGKPDAG
jgi:small conductance mechanosensitive channel